MEKKRWDPQCPKCQEELKRRLELLDSVFEDVDHGLIGRRLMEEDLYSGYCEHEEEKEG